MSEYDYTPESFFDKVDWEGGLVEAVLGYGIALPPEAREAGERFKAAYAELKQTLNEWMGEDTF